MKKIILAFTVSICLASLQAATVEITQRPNAAENHQLTFWELIYQNPLPDLPSYKNKEGVLLWGRIGAGKTTSAHYLAGAGFKRGEAQSVTPQNPNIKKEIS